MMRNSSLCSTYEYGNAEYWNARYLEEAGTSFDWYQRYSALRPFIRKFVPCSSRILMVGCGNALMSEDMVNDDYVDIMNIDISSIVIDMLIKSCAHIPQLKYMQMDVRDMSFFLDETFDSVIDKGIWFVWLILLWCNFWIGTIEISHGLMYSCSAFDDCFEGTLDSLMCGTDAAFSAAQMIHEVNRLLEPGGIYMLITYGDPSVRIPHLNQPGCCWKITLYILPRPGFKSAVGSSSLKSVMDPVPLTEKGLLPPDYVLEDPESHYIYVCKKMEG